MKRIFLLLLPMIVLSGCTLANTQSEKGEKGDQGLSAYQIYCKYHPDYSGNEEEWINKFCKDDSKSKLDDFEGTRYFEIGFINDVQILIFDKDDGYTQEINEKDYTLLTSLSSPLKLNFVEVKKEGLFECTATCSAVKQGSNEYAAVWNVSESLMDTICIDGRYFKFDTFKGSNEEYIFNENYFICDGLFLCTKEKGLSLGYKTDYSVENLIDTYLRRFDF